MIEYIIAAAAVGVTIYFYYRNDRLRRQQEAEEQEHEAAYHPVNGFDYIAAKERTDRQRQLLARYADANQLMDDVIVAIKSGEDLVINLSISSHCGEMHSMSASVHPELMQDLVRQILDDCAVECADCCSTPLPENCE